MPELEIHSEASDPHSQRVGIQAACIAVLLAVITISSHRAHTQAVVLKTDANDQWAYYQAKKVKSHVLELGVDLLGSLTAKDSAKTAEIQKKYTNEMARYEKDAEQIQKKAEEFHALSELEERKALRFDWGEGLLEMALVLASMFFISKRNVFPILSLAAGIVGVILSATGFFLGR